MPKLKIWVTDLGDPCQMAKRDWVIALFNCHGKVVEWCGKKYESVPAPCGYVEIDGLPPGTYMVRATAHSWWLNGILYGNWASDRGIVTLCCDCDACVTLYAPSVQACWIPLFEIVFKELATKKVLNEEVLRAAEVIQKQLSQLQISEFEKGEREVLLRMFKNTPKTDNK